MQIFKKALVFVLALVVLVSAAGCGKSKEQPPASADSTKAEATVAEPQKKGVTFSFAMPSSWTEYGGIKDLISQYQEKSGNTIELQGIKDDHYAQLIQTKLAVGECYDVFWTYTGTDATKISPDKNCVDLSGEAWVSNIEASILDAYVKYNDGKVYGCPIAGANVAGIAYNKKIFADLGLSVPKTLKEFDAVCSTIKEKNIVPLFWSAKDGWTMLQHFNAACVNILVKNPDVLGKLNKNEVQWKDVPGFVENYKNLADWKEKGYYNKNLAGASYEMQTKAIADGTAAMCFQGDWFASEVLKANADAQIGFFPLPTEDGAPSVDFGSPAAMWIYNNSKAIDAAKDFIAFMASPDTLNAYFAKRPDIPVFKGVIVSLNPIAADAQKYIQEGKVGKHTHSVYVAPLPYDDHVQAYAELLLGKAIPEQCAAKLSDSYVKNAKAMKLPGF